MDPNEHDRLVRLEALFEERWDGHHREHSLLAESLRTAKESSDRRLDGMNEFRDTLTDQAARFVTRDEWSGAHESLKGQTDERIAVLTKLVYMGVGGVTFIAACSGFIIWFVSKR